MRSRLAPGWPTLSKQHHTYKQDLPQASALPSPKYYFDDAIAIAGYSLVLDDVRCRARATCK